MEVIIITLTIPQGWLRVSQIDTDYTTVYAYLPVNTSIVEVEDLWYERRKGPSSEELKRHRVYGSPLTTPEGQFSALCHASFRFDAYYVDSGLPTNAAVSQQIISQYPSVPEVYTPHLLPGNQYGAGNGKAVYIGSDADGPVVDVLQVSANEYRGEWWSDMYRWCGATTQGDTIFVRYLRAGYGAGYAHRSYEKSRLSYWTADRFAEERDRLIPLLSYSGTGRAPVSDVVPTGASPDYVKAQATKALHSALKYRDTELVDWSVDALAYNVTPWALGNIDVITGRARSFIEATNDIPLLSENSLQNLAEAFSVLKAFAFGAEETSSFFDKVLKAQRPQDWYLTNARGRTRAQQRALQAKANAMAAQALLTSEDGEILDTAGDAWLKGRYAFSTSVSDLGQAWDYFYDLALQNIGKRSGDYKCHGSAVADGEAVAQCTFTTRERALEGVAKAFQFMYREGLEPNAYVLWDFVPFSFVVDWFFPIGNGLSAYTRASHFTPEYWDFLPVYDGKSFCYSLTYTSDSPFGPVDVYTRWYESGPPEVEAAYFLRQSTPASVKTCCMRTLDGLALFH